MRPPYLQPRDRRTLLIGLATIAALIGGSRGIPAYRALVQGETAAAKELADRLAHARVSVRVSGRTHDALEVASRRFALLSDSLLREPSLAAAAVALSTLVSDLAQASGVDVSALQIRSDSSNSTGLQRVAVEGSIAGDIAGLMSLLSMLEGGVPRIRVRELSVVQPDPAGSPGAAESLQIQLVIDGLAWIGAPAGGP